MTTRHEYDADDLGPDGVPDDVVCPWCGVGLTEGNCLRVDITDPPGTKPWDRTPEDAPRVHQLQCVTCTMNHGVYSEPLDCVGCGTRQSHWGRERQWLTDADDNRVPWCGSCTPEGWERV